MSAPVSLWLPYEVPDLGAAIEFYTVRIGLSQVDGWTRSGERGAVLRVPWPAHLELVQPLDRPARPATDAVPLAFELPSAAAVGPGGRRHPRGHYLVDLRDPAGAPVRLWSEQ